MANFARIIGGVAVDVSAAPAAHYHPAIAAEFEGVPDTVRPGWRLVDGAWQAPPDPEPLPEPEPAPVLTWANAPAEYWHIRKGPFFDRFGAKAIQITSNTDALVQGFIKLVEVREYIDLKRAEVIGGLSVLVAKNIVTAAERDAVLTTPTTDYERHVKGLPQPAAS